MKRIMHYQRFLYLQLNQLMFIFTRKKLLQSRRCKRSPTFPILLPVFDMQVNGYKGRITVWKIFLKII